MASAYGEEEPIDIGTAPEIFCDDLGRIDILGANVCWVFVRRYPHAGHVEEVVTAKMITPLSAVPSIAAQITAAFATNLTRRTVQGLSSLVVH